MYIYIYIYIYVYIYIYIYICIYICIYIYNFSSCMTVDYTELYEHFYGVIFSVLELAFY